MREFDFFVSCARRPQFVTSSLQNAKKNCLNADSTPESVLLGCNYGKKNGYVYVVSQRVEKDEKIHSLRMQNKTHYFDFTASGKGATAALSTVFSAYMGNIPEGIQVVSRSPDSEHQTSHSSKMTQANVKPLPRKKVALRGCEAPVQVPKGMRLKYYSSGNEYLYGGTHVSNNRYTAALRRAKLTLEAVSVRCIEQKLNKRANVSNTGHGPSCEHANGNPKYLLMCESSEAKNGTYVLAASKVGDEVEYFFLYAGFDMTIQINGLSNFEDRKVALAKFRQVAASFLKP